MSRRGFRLTLLYVFILAHIGCSLQSPSNHHAGEIPDAYSGENHHMATPITLDKIKQKLKESGVFNCHDPNLTAVERKQLGKLFDQVEIMTRSRARQPSNVQSIFSTLRVVERAVKKQLQEAQISESLAAKFRWENISGRHKRSPANFLDEKTKMLVFSI